MLSQLTRPHLLPPPPPPALGTVRNLQPLTQSQRHVYFPPPWRCHRGKQSVLSLWSKNTPFSARRPNLLDWEGVGSDGRCGGLGSFSNSGRAGTPVGAEVGVGLQEESGHLASTSWLNSCTFLAGRESLWMRKSQEAAGRVALPLPMCKHMLC